MAVLLVNTWEGGSYVYYNQTRFGWTGSQSTTLLTAAAEQHRTTSGVGGNYSWNMDDSLGTLIGVFTLGITAFSDYSGTIAGTVRATAQGHGLEAATTVIISGTTSYNGTFLITPIDSDSFYFTDTWVSNEAPGRVQFIPRFIHFWTKPQTGNALAPWSVQAPQGTTQQFEVHGATTGNILFYRGATLVQTNVAVWNPGVPHWIRIELVAAESGFCSVTIDEVLVATFTGDTRNTSVDGWEGLGFGGNYSGGVGISNQGSVIDDIIVTDAATGALAEQICTVITPNLDAVPNDMVAMSGAGAGTATGGDNYATVDDIPLSDTDWNQASAINQVDRYEMSALPAAITGVTLVRIACRAGRDGTITKGEVSVDSGGTVRYGPITQLPASPGYLNHTFTLLRDPNTGAAWTPAAVNALKAGHRFT